MKVGIVDYNSGNILSVMNAFGRLDVVPKLVTDAADFGDLTHLVLPGVGAFGYCFEGLKKGGLADLVKDWVLGKSKPLLGICVGMQLLADYGEEMEGSIGLGLIGGVVKKIPKFEGYRIPHVGWNSVCFRGGGEPFGKQSDGNYYFDHSFAFYPENQANILATVDHGQEIVAAVKKGKVIGVQFHPEKSQTKGLRLIQSFLKIE